MRDGRYSDAVTFQNFRDGDGQDPELSAIRVWSSSTNHIFRILDFRCSLTKGKLDGVSPSKSARKTAMGLAAGCAAGSTSSGSKDKV